MRITLAIILAVIAPTIGILPLFLRINPDINEKFNKKTKTISNIGCLVGIAIYISFIISLNVSKINPQVTYTEYPIQYLTTNKVYFDNNDGQHLNESNTVIEKPDSQRNNVVVVKAEDYESQWLWRIPDTRYTYYVYLSKDNYNKLQNPNVIYDNR